MTKRIDHWFSKVPEKSQPSGPLFSGKLDKPRFPLERWALWLGFFCPHWTPVMNSIYLAYTYQPVGKIKTDQPPSTRDVIALLKLRHHVASQRIQDFFKYFSILLINTQLYIRIQRQYSQTTQCTY